MDNEALKDLLIDVQKLLIMICLFVGIHTAIVVIKTIWELTPVP